MKIQEIVRAIKHHIDTDSRDIRIRDMYLPDGSYYVELMEDMGGGWRILWFEGSCVEGFISREELSKLRTTIIDGGIQ